MIRRSLLLGLGAGLALALASALTVSAHQESGATGLSVEPDSLAAGGSVVLVGTGLEPNSDRQLELAGPGMTVELGSVTTDAEGMFQKELTIPSHMPAGTYELRAIGDEVLTVQLALTAADGATVTASGSAADESVIPHQRHLLELGLIGGAAALLFVLGAALVRFAERFGHQPPTEAES